MPGITGIISKTQDREIELDQMVRCMLHEPFYNSGKYVNHDLGLSVGWTCHKGSFCDCMPIWNETKDIVLFFAGEHYGDESIIQNLKVKGHEVKGSMEANFLVHLYEEKKEEFLVTLNGFFHGVLVDLGARKIILFNDRYGMQRIYYHEGQNEVIFSSEAKSLLKIRPNLREISLNGLGELLSFGCVVGNNTLFSNVFLLPGASCWTFHEDGHVTKKQYFLPEALENLPVLDTEVFYEKLRDTFAAIAPRYFRSKSRVGLALTAGVDTRMMLAYVKLDPGTLQCYTFAGPYRDCFDVKISRKIAQLCKQSHYTLRLDREFFNQFPDLIEKVIYVTDGCLETSGVPNLYVNRLAREIAPVRLTGNYGQEVLRRYIAFTPNPPTSELFEPDFLPYVDKAKRTYNEMMRGNILSFALFKQAPWFHYGRLSLEQSQLVQRSPYMDNDLVALVYRAPLEVLSNSDLSLRMIRDGNPELAKIETDRGILGEARFPLAQMERGYREFLFKMDYYYSHGMLQWMASLNHWGRWLRLEKTFLGWHKYYHLRVWFREEWSDYIRDVLFSEKALGRFHLSKKGMRDIVERHMRDEMNFTRAINMALTVELIYRAFIDAN